MTILSFIIFGHKKYIVENVNVIYNKDTLVSSDSSDCVVYVSFIVNQEGKAEQINVDSCRCDSNKRYIKSIKKEALRRVKSLPDWNPAIKDGKHIRVKYTMPIKFTNNPDTIN